MRRPPRPGEMIVTRLYLGGTFSPFNELVTVPVVWHSGPWIIFGVRVPQFDRSTVDRLDQPRKKPRLVWNRSWRVHRFAEGLTWVRANTDEARATIVAEALR